MCIFIHANSGNGISEVIKSTWNARMVIDIRKDPDMGRRKNKIFKWKGESLQWIAT